MSFPSKRPFEKNASDPNGRGKWRKTAPSASQMPQGAVVFRVLCPVSKSGGIIGKGGGIVSRIRQETGAKVRLEEIIPGCEERIIVITGSEKDAEVSSENAMKSDENAGGSGGDQDDKTSGEDKEEKEDSSVLEGSKSDKSASSAQKALLLIFERIIEVEPKDGDVEEEASKDSGVTVRLLVQSSQVGHLVGKGGSVIKQMVSDSGAQIQISREKLPSCASANDEIVQITGVTASARKGLQLVSQLLIKNPPRDPFPAVKPPGPSSNPFSLVPRPEVHPSMQHLPPQGPPFSNRPYDAPDMPPFAKFHESFGSGQGSSEQLTFRLLCSNDKVGSVIGRGGSIVKSLKHETGCEIKIHETVPETDDRIIVISSPALPVDMISPAQDGVLRVQHRIAMAEPDGDDNVSSRLLVSSNQIGCLIGKGGAVIAEMRKFSRAQIRILTKEQLPESVPENYDVVQV